MLGQGFRFMAEDRRLNDMRTHGPLVWALNRGILKYPLSTVHVPFRVPYKG